MTQYIQVENERGLVRDASTRAILNRDTAAFERYQAQKQRLQQQKQQEIAQTNEINNIKAELGEIKQMLQILIREQHG